MTITARYPSLCTTCGTQIVPGQQIEWVRGSKSHHTACPVTTPVSTTPATNLIRVGGGSGYGYTPYTEGQVIHNTARAITEGQPEYLYVVRATQRYVRDEGMSFGVGDDSGYIYRADCRAATEAESAPLRQGHEAKRAKQQQHTALVAIADEIVTTGEYPAGSNSPEGREIMIVERSIYGTGRWLVVGPDWIWNVHNNGMDGDDWSRNNVQTSGAGAIGHRVRTTEALTNRIRSYAGYQD